MTGGAGEEAECRTRGLEACDGEEGRDREIEMEDFDDV